MRLADHDRAVILTCDARPGMAEHARDQLVAHGARDPAIRRNRGWPTPAGWRFAPGSWNHLVGLKGIVAEAARDGVGSLLFAEDDLRLTGDFDATVAAAEVPGDRAMLYYGAVHHWHPTTLVAPHVLRLAGSLATHCVAIRASAFPAILAMPEDLPADNAIGIHVHPALPCYAIWPSVARQAAVPSAIMPGGWSASEDWFWEVRS